MRIRTRRAIRRSVGGQQEDQLNLGNGDQNINKEGNWEISRRAAARSVELWQWGSEEGRSQLKSQKTKFGSSFSKLNLCEGGSFSTAIFNSDIQLSVHTFLCFISVCRFVE